MRVHFECGPDQVRELSDQANGAWVGARARGEDGAQFALCIGDHIYQGRAQESESGRCGVVGRSFQISGARRPVRSVDVGDGHNLNFVMFRDNVRWELRKLIRILTCIILLYIFARVDPERFADAVRAFTQFIVTITPVIDTILAGLMPVLLIYVAMMLVV